MTAWALFCHDFDLSKGINILSEKCPVVLDHYKPPYIEEEQFEKLSGIKTGITEFSLQLDGTVLWVSEDKQSFKRIKLKDFYYDQNLGADKAGREAENVCRKIDETACIKLDKKNHVFSIEAC